MGCGKSKLAIVSSNTILHRKKTNVGGNSSKKSKDIETVLETATNHDNSVANPNVQQQQQQQQQHEQLAAEISSSSSSEQQVNKDNNVENVGVNVGGGDEATSSVVADVKDIDEDNNNNDNKKNEIDDEAGNKEEEDGIVNGGGVTVVEDDHHQQEPERLISHGSSNRFFSTRKLDEEGFIDGIISEGQSGASDYHTPRHGSKSNLYFKVDNTAEDKQVLDPAQTKPAHQAQNNNGEPVKVEEKLVKAEAEKEITTTTGPVEAKVSGPVEAEVSGSIEARVSGPAEEEKKESENKSGI